MNEFVQYNNIVPILAPQDIVDTATDTPFLALKNVIDGGFLVYFGALTTATATDVVVITMEAATAGASGSEAQVGFRYRKSGATGANTWGDITEVAATAGVEIASTDDNKLLWIELEPAAIQAAKADATHVRLNINPSDMAATLVSVVAMFNPIYKQATHLSAT